MRHGSLYRRALGAGERRLVGPGPEANEDPTSDVATGATAGGCQIARWRALRLGGGLRTGQNPESDDRDGGQAQREDMKSDVAKRNVAGGHYSPPGSVQGGEQPPLWQNSTQL